MTTKMKKEFPYTLVPLIAVHYEAIYQVSKKVSFFAIKIIAKKLNSFC